MSNLPAPAPDGGQAHDAFVIVRKEPDGFVESSSLARSRIRVILNSSFHPEISLARTLCGTALSKAEIWREKDQRANGAA
jgi:hypothetical protein